MKPAEFRDSGLSFLTSSHHSPQTFQPVSHASLLTTNVAQFYISFQSPSEPLYHTMGDQDLGSSWKESANTQAEHLPLEHTTDTTLESFTTTASAAETSNTLVKLPTEIRQNIYKYLVEEKNEPVARPHSDAQVFGE